MNVDIKGTVHKYGEIITNKDGLYPKRELVIFQPNGDYPDYINIEVQERVFDNFKDIKEGDEVNVITNFGGRLWTNPEGIEKCFNNCKGWKCDILNKTSDVSANNVQAMEAQSAEPEQDLPF